MLAEIPGEVHVSQFSLEMELGEYYFPQVHVMILSLVDSKCTYVQDFSKSNKCFFAMCLWILTWIYSSFWANMYIFTPLGSILFKFFHHLLETLLYTLKKIIPLLSRESFLLVTNVKKWLMSKIDLNELCILLYTETCKSVGKKSEMETLNIIMCP